MQLQNGVLDVGCHTGRFMRCADAIAERVVGLDIGPDSVNHGAG